MGLSEKPSFRHALFISTPGWGHLRPLVSLAARLIWERSDVIITFTIPGDYELQVENEIDRYFSGDQRSLKKNIRLVHLGGSSETDLLQVYKTYFQGFAKVYPAIYNEEPVFCATGRTYRATSKPDVILLDPFLLDMLQTIRKVSEDTVPVLAWNTAALTAMLRFYGPSSLGGLDNVPLKAETLAKDSCESIDEVISKLYQPQTGDIIELPGMPAMYDYEFNRQHNDELMNAFKNTIYPMTYQFFEECDGMIALGNESFEPEACAAYRTWFAPRPTYFVGPLLPDEPFVGDKLLCSQEKELTGSSNGAEVKNFLDTIRGEYGDHSLLYISFGSHFWPGGEAVWKVLEVALDMKIPLVFSCNIERINMPTHIQEQFHSSKVALVSAWAPQHLILGHRATGWFLTHCGNNSVTEAVSHGVPMIGWPLGADQFVNAGYMSSTLNIAYELFETRIGVGLKPLRRGIQPEGTLQAIEKEARSVFTKAWGPDGMRKREKIQVLRKKVNMAWDEDGEARQELHRFLDRYLPVI